MQYERIILNKERNVSLTAMIQEVGGEFRGIDRDRFGELNEALRHVPNI